MTFIEWKDSYQTGLAGYDAQHQTLFRLANRIHECLANESPGSDLEISSVFGAFLEMTRAHIRTEDELMVWHGYSSSEHHEEAHSRFLEGLELIAGQDSPGPNKRGQLALMLDMFKAHFEAEDEQAFLALLHQRNFPSAS